MAKMTEEAAKQLRRMASRAQAAQQANGAGQIEGVLWNITLVCRGDECRYRTGSLANMGADGNVSVMFPPGWAVSQSILSGGPQKVLCPNCRGLVQCAEEVGDHGETCPKFVEKEKGPLCDDHRSKLEI